LSERTWRTCSAGDGRLYARCWRAGTARRTCRLWGRAAFLKARVSRRHSHLSSHLSSHLYDENGIPFCNSLKASEVWTGEDTASRGLTDDTVRAVALFALPYLICVSTVCVLFVACIC